MDFDTFFHEFLPNAVHPKLLDDNPRYQKALDFKVGAGGDTDVDYSWIWEYAKNLYNESLGTQKTLDDKASEIIKYLGGGAGLFTLAALANIKPENAAVLGCAIPSFAFSVIAVFFASLARQPCPTPSPPTIEAAMAYASHFQDPKKAMGAFLGQWHAACEGIDVANETKAQRVQIATWAFFLVIASLSLPLVAAILLVR